MYYHFMHGFIHLDHMRTADPVHNVRNATKIQRSLYDIDMNISD